MTCAEFEVLLCDYLDQQSGRASTLTADEAAAVERHMAECAVCAELARDAGSALSFMEQAAAVEPPPELLTKIMFELPLTHRATRPGSPAAAWIRRVLGPVLQPRFAMGMALTVLSFSMMAQCAGVKVPQLRPADLKPGNIWAGLEDRVHRTWERSVKSYESIRFVYEMQARLRDWTEAQQQEDRAQPDQQDDRRLPAAESPARQNQNTNQNQNVGTKQTK